MIHVKFVSKEDLFLRGIAEIVRSLGGELLPDFSNAEDILNILRSSMLPPGVQPTVEDALEEIRRLIAERQGRWPVPGQWQYTPDPNVTWAPVTNPYSTGHFFDWGTGYSITTSGTIKLDNMATTPTNIIENSNSSSDYVNYTSNLIDYEKI